MGTFFGFIFGFYIIGIFISWPFFWAKKTDRSQAPIVRRGIGLVYAFTWPYVIVQYFRAVQSNSGVPGPPASSAPTSHPRSGNITAADLERFGRSEYDPTENRWPWPSSALEFLAPMYERYQADPDGFMATLARIADETGGWAAYGAEKLMFEVAGGRDSEELSVYDRIMKASLGFLRSLGVPPKMLTGYEWNYWLETGGTIESWIPRRPMPTQDEAPISPLRIGEIRRLAQIFPDPESNMFLVQRAQDGSYCWTVDARYSDEDTRRTQRVHKTSDSLHDLYAQIGLSLQTPPYWCDRELEPYIPLPSPSL
jgi:hypothetical protein